MKKHSNLAGLLGIVALMFTTMAFLFPIAPGILADGLDLVRGYDFVFTSPVAPFTIDETPGLVAMFVLFIVGAFFELLGVALGWFGGKFGGFLAIVGGLCMAVAAVLVFVSPAYIETTAKLSLAWGFIATGAAAAVSAIIELFVGVKAFMAK